MEQHTTTTKRSICFRDMLTRPEPSHAICLGIFCLLSCLILPLSDRIAWDVIYLLAVAVFFYLLTHSVRAILCYALPAIVLYALASLLPALPDPILLPTAFTSLVMGGASGGFLLTHYYDLKKYPYVLALPVAAYALTALITGDLLRGLLALLPFALAIVAALCVLLYLKRTDATLLLTVTLAVTLLAAGLLTYAVMGIEGSPLTFVTDTVRGGITALFADMEAMYAEMGVSLGLTDISISNTATMLINLLPGLCISLCSITAFLTLRLLLQFLVILRSVPHLPLRLGGLTMSRTSAVLFLAAFVLSLFANYSTATLFGTVCDNVALVLEPGLALVGITALLPQGSARSCFSTCLLFLILIAICTNPILGLELAATIGAVCILTARLTQSHDQDNKGVK